MRRRLFLASVVAVTASISGCTASAADTEVDRFREMRDADYAVVAQVAALVDTTWGGDWASVRECDDPARVRAVLDAHPSAAIALTDAERSDLGDQVVEIIADAGWPEPTVDASEEATTITSEGDDGFLFVASLAADDVTIDLQTACVNGDRDVIADATRSDPAPW